VAIENDLVTIEIDTSAITSQKADFDTAVRHCEAGKYNRAKPILEKLIQKNPTVSEYHRILGQKIQREFDFRDFESEFSSGIDMPARYVENIDVVWKEEFRIDAAFEVEHSTAIYSGLLRFADLKVIAPNINYPLFIVAPSAKKNRVFDQLKRPSFKKLGLDKEVRYLSYEAIDDIDKFFESSTSGLNVDLIIGKSESVR